MAVLSGLMVHESIADLAAFVRPVLTILDGYRVLARNGPAGGRVEDVELRRTVIAGTDPVALDAWAGQTWWGLDPARQPYLQMAAVRGLGTPEWGKVRMSTKGVN